MSDAPAPRATTLQDVAREAGVSLATASRVLNGSTRNVAGAYRERVEAVADRLGYSANLSAQATARGTSATIALLVADIADPYFSRIASGVAHAADDENLVLTIGITERATEREARLVRNLRGQRPRGIVLAASRSSHTDSAVLTAMLHDVESAGGTIVSIGAPAGTANARTVAIDDRGGALELGRALAQRGYRDAIALAAADGLVTSDDRLAGFSEGFGTAGGNAPRVLRTGFSRAEGYHAMSAALEDGVLPGTVVFAITDVVAIGAMSAIRDAGRGIGDDIAVAGFGSIPFASDVTPTLTSVNAPLELLGEAAVRAVVAAEWTPPAPLPLSLAIRDSTPPR
ncbi:LacI family DNA-binding transcriptional regulator [Microbacterium sp. JB110]|uniref:LacI family DNA-binding transcriptional regulator n=1 Tax=Microbacterium sp. JB110 TaxID=2024477 RepID=UPI00097F486E|nr:LacI family DNA-binding transcriptional regulator [Microbacterium sp. JB110]RCS58799.1 LacI family transcriptional regulator [Microbacterium sp. JB110]SJM54575.1 regulatory protein, LacI [Frigoribacterium sp. JB110]